LRNLLHKCRTCTPNGHSSANFYNFRVEDIPWLVVSSLPNLGLHFAYVEDDILGLRTVSLRRSAILCVLSYLIVHAFEIIHSEAGKRVSERL
jgi:hypothetical protein